MEKTLKTFIFNVNNVMINGRVLCVRDELVVSFPNGYEHLFVGYNIHYQYVHPDYEVILTLYNKDDDRYKLYIRKENAFCSRAYKLVVSETDEEFIYPLIAESTAEIGNDKFAIFDIHTLKKKRLHCGIILLIANLKAKMETTTRFCFAAIIIIVQTTQMKVLLC